MLRITDEVENDSIKDMLKDSQSGEISSIPSPVAFARYIESRLQIWTRRFNCVPYDSRILDDKETHAAFEQLYYRIADESEVNVTPFDSVWVSLLRAANSAYIKNRSYMDVRRFAEEKAEWPNFMRIVFVAQFTRISLNPNPDAAEARRQSRDESRRKSLRESQVKLRSAKASSIDGLRREFDTATRMLCKLDNEIAALNQKRNETLDSWQELSLRIALLENQSPESVHE